jgi:hypothetical protein
MRYGRGRIRVQFIDRNSGGAGELRLHGQGSEVDGEGGLPHL